MKSIFALTALVTTARANPLAEVFALMDELKAKITKDSEAEAKAYTEFFEWCDGAAANAKNSIKTATKQKGKLEAKIGEYAADIEVAGSKIDELAGSIASGEKELTDATGVRSKEVADFAASEKELMEAIDALNRAHSILEKEMAKNPASLAQLDTSNIAKAVQAVSVVLDAAAFSTQDQKKLMGFIQAQQNSDDEEFSAPVAASYKSQSGGIVDLLEDLRDKAEGQLSDLRKGEVNNKHNYDMLKQSLEDQSSADKKDLDDEKSGRSEAKEAKADAEGELKSCIKELDTSDDELATTSGSCLQQAADHEATVAARKDELAVIAQAKKILKESTSGAEGQTYSFAQTDSQLTTHHDLIGAEAIAVVKRVAKEQNAPALAQLASRMMATLRFRGSGRDDPFGKVKGLISDMISKLEKEADSDATEKAYCDEQMAKTEAKKGELEEDLEKATTKIDTANSKSAQLNEEIKELESELAALTKEQAELDKIRGEESADFSVSKTDLEAGLAGVRKALQVLQEYYGSAAASMIQGSKLAALMQQPAAPEKHSASSGAGGSIINILQVVESDFATNLAKEETEESDAQTEYEKITQGNAVSKTGKEQDLKYKSQNVKELAKTVAEYSSDRDTAHTELSAVLEYYSQIKARCIAKPETYENRKARRVAEIAGLKQALSILEDEAALVQRKRRGHFRGSLSA